MKHLLTGGTVRATMDETTDVDGNEQIELTERQRRRFDRIKMQCTDGGSLPEPTDQAVVESLLDTWDAVDAGLYSEDSA